jgi:hypothetical protein
MNLNDVLGWIARYPGHAFVTGVFILFFLGIVCEFVVKLVRSVTGKYPAPSPVVQCNCESEEDDAA